MKLLGEKGNIVRRIFLEIYIYFVREMFTCEHEIKVAYICMEKNGFVSINVVLESQVIRLQSNDLNSLYKLHLECLYGIDKLFVTANFRLTIFDLTVIAKSNLPRQLKINTRHGIPAQITCYRSLNTDNVYFAVDLWVKVKFYVIIKLFK